MSLKWHVCWNVVFVILLCRIRIRVFRVRSSSCIFEGSDPVNLISRFQIPLSQPGSESGFFSMGLDPDHSFQRIRFGSNCHIYLRGFVPRVYESSREKKNKVAKIASWRIRIVFGVGSTSCISKGSDPVKLTPDPQI